MAKEKLYVLVEFPYPSGSGLHIGHAFTFTGADVYARFQRMAGKDVLFPMGWDAFGLPTENYALRTGRKPQDVTQENTQIFRRQMEEIGFSFDWDRLVNTSDPSYYKWTQWIFIKLFQNGLAEKQEMPINWCPSCKVGLANEEVVEGRCERCGTEATRRRISQWVVKITRYADRLISGLQHTDFIEKVKTAQVNWIGRSEGARIRFPVQGLPETLEIFTTRPDTLWGCTFMVVAPEHILAEAAAAQDRQVAAYVQASLKKPDLERMELNRQKTGVPSGFYATNPATGKGIPIWVSDFVLPTYGTGAIMAVPAHDERDHAFAHQYGLPIVPVIQPEGEWDFAVDAYTGAAGRAFNSGPIDGLPVAQAIPSAIDWLDENGLGERSVSYHLRDWIFSRQHYWGEPIPLIKCQQCGWVPVSESDLPVRLPDIERYQPAETGESPLANVPEWVQTTCPTCQGPARRETDTMPNWAGSNWYFLRYVDPHNDQRIADLDKLRYWLPVDLYIGGDEHNNLHMLYSRFIYQFLYDLGVMPSEHPEPYCKRISHGVILGPDGQRMSKSHGNVVIPDDMLHRYGADVVRAYLMFIGPFDATMAWNERAMLGVKRFLERFERFVEQSVGRSQESTHTVRLETNRIIKSVGEDIPALKFNTALAKIMEGLNTISKRGQAISNADLKIWVQALFPFAPFLAQACWQRLGGVDNVQNSRWPSFDLNLAQEEPMEISVQVNGKLRGTLLIDRTENEESIKARAATLENVERQLQQGQLLKTIVVPGRTVNFVIRS
jgi:leucyl-tRNA synthetase